jgi:hypothetical protein
MHLFPLPNRLTKRPNHPRHRRLEIPKYHRTNRHQIGYMTRNTKSPPVSPVITEITHNPSLHHFLIPQFDNIRIFLGTNSNSGSTSLPNYLNLFSLYQLPSYQSKIHSKKESRERSATNSSATQSNHGSTALTGTGRRTNPAHGMDADPAKLPMVYQSQFHDSEGLFTIIFCCHYAYRCQTKHHHCHFVCCCHFIFYCQLASYCYQISRRSDVLSKPLSSASFVCTRIVVQR